MNRGILYGLLSWAVYLLIFVGLVSYVMWTSRDEPRTPKTEYEEYLESGPERSW